MPNIKKDKAPGNIYDRVFRENAEHLFIPLIEQFLNIKIVSYEVLQVKFPKTTEHEVDFLYKIIQEDQSKQILHIEFQSNNDPTMLERMQEYHSKIYKKFKLPVKPLVINLSKKAFTARRHLQPEEIFTGYGVINLFELSTEELLSSQVPEVVVLALLSNYKEDQIESILRLIVQKLKQIVKTEKDLRRFITQLLLLSRLRNFEMEIEKILDIMPITYDIEKDGLYLRGVEKGLEKGVERGIEKGVIVCHEIGLESAKIAEKFEISLQIVLDIIRSYKQPD